MPLYIVPLYAALLALLYLVLTANVIRHRYRMRVALGSGGDALLERAIRVHANFNEYVPLALVLLAFNELHGVAPGWLHVLGFILLAGRVSHAFGVSREPEKLYFRSIGMVSTFAVLLISAGMLLAQLF